jgi:hypothetical protein
LIFAGTVFLALAIGGICVRRLRAKSRSRNRWVDYQLEELKIEAMDVPEFKEPSWYSTLLRAKRIRNRS